MSDPLSPNTRAALLLMAPLIAGGEESTPEPLTAREYLKLVQVLAQLKLEPADLLGKEDGSLPAEVRNLIECERYQDLLAREVGLDRALDYWHSRDIWVVGCDDEGYPKPLSKRLKDHAPPIIYGCGDGALLETGGLAVVGSRQVDANLIDFTETIGRMAAEAERTIVSGAARGVDQAAMRGALGVGGTVVGVLADSLERISVNREHRQLLREGKLALMSPYDPAAGFNIGHAMQRNKLIYALSDAALVVNSDHEKGGTWSGAVEQLEKLHFVPIYVRSTGEIGKGLAELQLKGALPWPNPTSADEFDQVMTRLGRTNNNYSSQQLSLLET